MNIHKNARLTFILRVEWSKMSSKVACRLLKPPSYVFTLMFDRLFGRSCFRPGAEHAL
ncbi:hypothetical protein [Massilia sp. MS-15]|uniref:hypothetical protein n=1 Tax=Massilia sp. MS-15 TaxID=2878200 RepID=UPI001CD391C7|nr:hypothetical protein [Massilia sp. MS-15]MCA1247721.1 hypothetical protein [Massilia sp. MS-15]